MRILPIVCLLAAAVTSHAQPPPDTTAQKEAMKKLAFLVGKWSGEAVTIGSTGPFKVLQTEEVQYKLDGLLLLVEGTGRNPDTGEVVFRALATIAYDEPASAYRFRAYNYGRYLDTELRVPDKGFEWGYKAEGFAVRFVMRLNDRGDWVETGEVTMGNNPPRKTFEMTVRRQR